MTTDTLARALDALERLAASGDGTAAAALALLRGRLGGAGGAKDDRRALDAVLRLRAMGRGREAVGAVAARLAGIEGVSAASIARRLRRKLKRTGAVSVSDQRLD